LRWGTGYTFNPTDVVSPSKELSDPDNEERRLTGNDLIKFEYFGGSYSFAFCYLTKLKFDSKLYKVGDKFAFRFYKNIWDIDISFISLANKYETPIWGFNFSSVIGERLEIHGEANTQKGSYYLYYNRLNDGFKLYSQNPFGKMKISDNKYYNQYLVGLQYTFPGNILWISEYYHQDQGYSKADWNQIVKDQKHLISLLASPFDDLAKGNLLWNLNVFTPKGSMKDYWINYISAPITNRLEIRFTQMINLTDLSFVSVPAVYFQVKNHFTFYLRCFIFKGKNESEFGEFFQSCSIEGGIRF
jgi:hypothetical protein